LKLLVGVSPKRAGVFSAGNGPAMRAPILGVLIADESQLAAFARASTRLTHIDPKAEIGALAIAFAARCAAKDEIAARIFVRLQNFHYRKWRL